MGVEKEYFLVDPASRTPQPAAAAVVARVVPDLGDLICGEFTRYQAEVKTPPGRQGPAVVTEKQGPRLA
jgi:glutamate---cysteine ligase / carboxylate-amine ligase